MLSRRHAERGPRRVPNNRRHGTARGANDVAVHTGVHTPKAETDYQKYGCPLVGHKQSFVPASNWPGRRSGQTLNRTTAKIIVAAAHRIPDSPTHMLLPSVDRSKAFNEQIRDQDYTIFVRDQVDTENPLVPSGLGDTGPNIIRVGSFRFRAEAFRVKAPNVPRPTTSSLFDGSVGHSRSATLRSRKRGRLAEFRLILMNLFTL